MDIFLAQCSFFDLNFTGWSYHVLMMMRSNYLVNNLVLPRMHDDARKLFSK